MAGKALLIATCLWSIQPWSGLSEGDPDDDQDFVRCVALLKNRNTFFFGCEFGEIWKVTLRDCSEPPDITFFADARSPIEAIIPSLDEKKLVSGHHDGSIKIWNASTGKLENTWKEHKRWVVSLAFAADGKTLVSSDSGGRIHFREWETGRQISTLQSVDKIPFYVVKFALSGKIFVAGDGRGSLHFYNADREPFAERLAHTKAVTAIAVSEDGKRLASCSQDGGVEVCTLGKRVRELFTWELKPPVMSVDISSDGKLLASAGGAGSCAIWDLVAGKKKVDLAGTGFFYCIKFSSDGSVVVGGTTQNTVVFFDSSSGKRLHAVRLKKD